MGDFQMRYIIDKTPDGWSIYHLDSKGNVWPTTVKRSAREVVSRLMQLLEIGPVAPQTFPEEVCIGSISTEGDNPSNIP
jgi:hypothetical protein